MWPSKLMAEMPADEFGELCQIAETELVGLERSDYMLAQVACQLSSEEGKSPLDFMPFPNTQLDDAIEVYLDVRNNQ